MAEMVLVGEDERQIADLLEMFLRAEGYRTERGRTGKEILQLWRSAQPDAILLDLMLPELDGLSVLRQIRAESSVPILIVTARVEDIDRLIGLELGADDYILKPFNPREVVARVRAVLRRVRGWSPPPTWTAGPFRVDEQAMQAYCGDRAVLLTPVQFRLFSCMVRSAGKAFHRSELLDLFEEDAPDARTIDAHIKNLRARLGQEGRRIETVRGVGYRLNPS
jgi:two-component system response regulator BaeR/two-component system response regulator AdeR